MPNNFRIPGHFLAELRRGRLVRAALVYGAATFGVLEEAHVAWAQTVDALPPAAGGGLATEPAQVVPDALASSSRVNPFAGFERHYLSNGMKLWFKHLEGAPNVTASVVVPYGRDLDPPRAARAPHRTHALFGPRRPH